MYPVCTKTAVSHRVSVHGASAILHFSLFTLSSSLLRFQWLDVDHDASEVREPRPQGVLDLLGDRVGGGNARVRVQGAEDIDPAWLAGVTCVGITAGASTPDYVIDEVERRLQALAPTPA